MKRQRQNLIVELIDREEISSQEQLRRRLKARGVSVTQATLSRDVRELGLIKRPAGGAYARPGAEPTPPASAEAALRHALSEFLRDADQVQQLLVLRTNPGQASALAEALDRARPHGLVGTIAGDNTILAICRSSRVARALRQKLNTR